MQPTNQAQPIQVPTYLTRFACLGSDCEDHCCQGWRINLDKTDYQTLKGLRKKAPVVFHHFEEVVFVEKTQTSPRLFATLDTSVGGHCQFLEEGLCAIHRDHGEHKLPKTCATYPRKTFDFGKQLVMSGMTSCPEMARLCLLAPDAFVPSHLEGSQIPTVLDPLPWLEDSQNLFVRASHQVRKTLLALLDQHEWTTAQNLYLLIYLSKRIESCFYPAMTDAVWTKLEKHLEKMGDPVTQRQLLRGQDSPSGSFLIHVQLILLLLTAREKHDKQRYNLLKDQVLSTYQLNQVNDLSEGQAAEVLKVFRERRNALSATYGPFLEQVFHHYSLNHWYLEPLYTGQGLGEFVRRFALSYATLQFALFSHPDVDPLLEAGHDPVEGQKRLEACVVSVFQVYTRCMTHNSEMMSFLGNLVNKFGLNDVASLTALINL